MRDRLIGRLIDRGGGLTDRRIGRLPDRQTDRLIEEKIKLNLLFYVALLWILPVSCLDLAFDFVMDYSWCASIDLHLSRLVTDGVIACHIFPSQPYTTTYTLLELATPRCGCRCRHGRLAHSWSWRSWCPGHGDSHWQARALRGCRRH